MQTYYERQGLHPKTLRAWRKRLSVDLVDTPDEEMAGGSKKAFSPFSGARPMPFHVELLTNARRSYGSNVPPVVVFHYALDRTSARPAEHLKTFRGILQVDGYAGFEALADRGAVTLAACRARARRKFFELHEVGSPVATEAVQRIGKLYEIEATIRGRPADEWLRVRRKQSLPLVEVLQAWLELQLSRLSGRSRSAEAIRYAVGRWTALTRFLDDGRIALDNNPVERAIRPIALGRKNSLFAGSEGGASRWAIVVSLVETAKLNGVEAYAWLRDSLTRMVDGHPVSRLDELLPWRAERVAAEGA